MKKVLFSLFLVFLVYIIFSLYFLDKKYFVCPIRYPSDFIIRADSMGNGLFATPRSGRRIHQGIDLLAEVGEPVLAGRRGIVIAAGKNRGMGNFIVLRHSPSVTSIYGHLLRIYVAKGELVRQGDIIGAVGKTGNANYQNMQPHLHFEVRKNGIPQDPQLYLD
jgi:murein DD-endopeptidase MepM/ murein hydrolase activator NlpD